MNLGKKSGIEGSGRSYGRKKHINKNKLYEILEE